ncbi:disease resistance protein Pik-2 isoform X1 [Aegilops tauschii subsp. strangulata]|nr:disease resistance protein Pik-2 [Aegilops tauschii subsp. strangulata]
MMDVGTGRLFPKLLELLLMDEHKLQKCDKGDLERLSRELKSTQLVLRKLAEVLDNQVSLWADNARELSHGIEKDVDDILVLIEEGKDFTKKMANLFKGKTRYQISRTIGDIEQRLLKMPKRRNRFKVDGVLAYQRSSHTAQPTSPPPQALRLLSSPRMRGGEGTETGIHRLSPPQARSTTRQQRRSDQSSSLFPKLFELLFMDEYKLLKCDKGDLERLSRELKSAQLVLCMLADVPRGQLDNLIRLWAGNARELSYVIDKDVDDLLVLEEGNEFTEKLANLFKGSTRYQIAHTIRGIEQRLLEMPKTRNRFKVNGVAANLGYHRPSTIFLLQASNITCTNEIQHQTDSRSSIDVRAVQEGEGCGEPTQASTVTCTDEIQQQTDSRSNMDVGAVQEGEGCGEPTQASTVTCTDEIQQQTDSRLSIDVRKGHLFPKLSELLFMDEHKLLKCDKRELERLSRELKSMQLVLRKLAEQPWEQLNNQIRLWTDNARELSYVIEKDIDDILALEEGKEFTKKMANLFKGKTRYQIAHTIRDIEQRLLKMPKRCNRFRVDDVAAKLYAPPVGDPYTYEGEIIGIEHARDELVQVLCNGDNQLNILSVVGSGGLGKTTLAKAVYHKLKTQFDCKTFVPVSQNPDMQKVLMHILYDLHKQSYSDNRAKGEMQLIHEISKFLQTKRYLIVIDDLWDENSWNTISLSLPSNDCGSRVITTTRVNKIAEKCCLKNKDLIYEIMPLGYQYSKRLFLKRCFGSEDSCPDALTEVDEILKICGGMPLAIISVASADFPFSAGKIKERCQEIMKSLHSAVGGLCYVEGLTRILLCSYFDLPDTLRACLLYLAASARNQSIQRDSLVRKWIAEGLVPKDKSCSPEEVARRYFDELINRNVIQPVKYLNCLGKETYEVTYMMLYVLRLISREQDFATFFSESEPHVEVMPNRLFMRCSDTELLISTERMNLTNVCSVTMLGPANPVSLKQLKNVQVLDLDGCEDLDNSGMDDICRMIKLKYLSLKQTQVTEIPPEISNLQNLETLDVSWTQISNLPPEIRKLQNLVTLDVRQTQVKDLPKEVLQLRRLKHLPFVCQGCFGVKLSGGIDQLKPVQVMGTVDSRECSESAMKEISELIEVTELELVLYDGLADMEKNDKLLSSVGKCSYLKSLTIYGDSNPSDKLSPESPNFPQLEKLKVAGRFVKVPGWIAQLSTLTLLDIRVWKLEANDLMIIGGLPCLSVLALALVALPRKQVSITSSAGFVRLEVFCFDCCVPWVSFEDKAMPNLKQLQLNLYHGPADKVPSGIMLLERLNMVILLYSSQHAASDGVFETIAVVREDAASHANLIKLSINGDREIFLPNKTADRGFEREFDTSVSRVITEVEEVLASE